ncbi:MAG: Rne/Rng family ribonuclease [Puniceicoccales bacterium]|jgi:ribonuclease G|nr:Rne/Rng family ribonuclease [Puniceicoccales bacterium]
MNRESSSWSAVPENLSERPDEVAAAPIDGEWLGKKAQIRAKKQPLMQKIIKNILRGDGKFRELMVSRNFVETRLALLVDGKLEAFEVERAGGRDWVGAIFKGRIQNLEPGLKAAFVITGQERNAFLHYWDMLPAANDSFEIVSGQRSGREITPDDIPKMYPTGSEIVVQVTKAQMGTKGPRVTSNISLPGRYMVLTPYDGRCGISRKISDGKERDRLKGILRSMALPSGMGAIIRTAGTGKRLKCFLRDLSLLLQEWQRITKKMEEMKGPGLLYREPELAERAVRDFLTDDVDLIAVDRPDLFSRILEAVDGAIPRMRSRVQLYDGKESIMEHFHAEEQINRLFARRLTLPSGGEIVIEETEALVAIDVNTGSHRNRKKDGGGYMLQVNLEAAEEIVRQMRLRGLGGLIVIDFIDMASSADQKKLQETVQRLMEVDTERFQILPISPFGTMQISRQRHSQSLCRDTRRSCPYCDGRGTVESASATAVRALTALQRAFQRSAPAAVEERQPVRLVVHPDVLRVLRRDGRDELEKVEKAYGTPLTVSANEAIHRENFSIEGLAGD